MTRAKYPVVIHPTRDVTLQGRADLAYWTSELAAQQLRPQAADGLAQLWITATESRFLGIRFCELSISVIVDSVPPAAAGNGVYFVAAFNSVGWFAWVERNLFGAPYRSADISVSPEVPCGIELSSRGAVLLAARMAADDRNRRDLGMLSWEGNVYLPSAAGTAVERSKMFGGMVAGKTSAYAFAPRDTLTIAESAEHPALRHLRDSNFHGWEWHVRTGGQHGKGKTVRRGRD